MRCCPRMDSRKSMNGNPDNDPLTIGANEELQNEFPEGIRSIEDMIAPANFVAPPSENANWNPKKLSTRHKYMAHLAALGLKRSEIAARCGVTPQVVTYLFGSTLFLEYVDKLRKELFSSSPEQALRLMIPKALNAIDDVLSDPDGKDALKVDTAFRLFDRTHGKPNQKIEHGGSVIKDLFEQLNALQDKGTVIDIEPEYTETEITGETNGEVQSEAEKSTENG